MSEGWRHPPPEDLENFAQLKSSLDSCLVLRTEIFVKYLCLTCPYEVHGFLLLTIAAQASSP